MPIAGIGRLPPWTCPPWTCRSYQAEALAVGCSVPRHIGGAARCYLEGRFKRMGRSTLALLLLCMRPAGAELEPPSCAATDGACDEGTQDIDHADLCRICTRGQCAPVPCRPARFGPNSAALAGPLEIPAEPRLCEPLLRRVRTGAVVLAWRGGCSFDTKARHAQRAGAVAIAVVDSDAASSELPVLSAANPSNIHIPVLALRAAEGEMLLRRVHAERVVRRIARSVFLVRFARRHSVPERFAEERERAARALARSRSETFGPIPASRTVTQPAQLQSKLPRPAKDVALVTHCALDSLPLLRRMAAAWGGSISAALHVPSPADMESAMREASQLHAEVEALGHCRLDLTLMAGLCACTPRVVSLACLVECPKSGTAARCAMELSCVTPPLPLSARP